MAFARWVFRVAAIYGVIVLAPLYFLEAQVSAVSPVNHPENYYGFIGAALAFQALFFVISTDPGRYRAAIIPSILEKVSFGGAVIPLWLAGRVPGVVAAFSAVDLIWAVLFTASWVRTRPAS
ncbi:MAG: hypothetical protein ACK4YQ_11440 [Phenylobacterium sp.]|uniref:hypothetical protein n=1 Tax=Phenylobacterium sp. TaxID=1871053 RepID=UPI003918CD96